MGNNKEKQRLTSELFDRLYRENANMVRQVVMEYENNAAIVQELVQETFAEAWASRNKFRGEAQAATWLYAIASNVCGKHVRDNVERAPEVLSEWQLAEERLDEYGESWLEQHSVEYDDPEALLIAEQEAALGYSDLSPQEEQVFDLMYVRDLSATETAEELGLERQTVYAITERIRKKIS